MQKQGLQIRSALESEAEPLSQLSRKTFDETFSPHNRKEDMDLHMNETFSREKQRADILNPKFIIKMAWVENEPAGYFQLSQSEPDPCVTGPKPLELLRLYVDSRWHGRGVGPALMDHCFEIARAKGYETLWLGVWEHNLKAQAFYKKYGFHRVGEHVFRLGTDDQIDFILMRLL